MTVGPLKFEGTPWALVAVIGFAVIALIVITSWVSPAEVTELVETTRWVMSSDC